MIDKKPIFVEEMKWKNDIYALELYNSINFSGLKSVTQVQAVCFTDDNDVVLYQHSDNYLGLPGGTPEEGESFEETLKRELYEELKLDFPNDVVKLFSVKGYWDEITNHCFKTTIDSNEIWMVII